ncbi:PREDICTED: breast cancer type 1 susceptibility protein homolog [Polistes canadensis]|uniref:breast cancer type 1 susceptibility protein homolog n=1 Tax=Polistes canadensis TaxID=91411 RepID=UPI000718CEE2|nr:PREDICTED: breast cancer type 1 susceptibility protein homolog [Polistes canadensis]
MTEDQIMDIDIISDAVKSINNCLQCRICLDTISSPVKTRCGHSFCRTCIATVLNKKNGKCPLCNFCLHRRSISKDKHIEKSIKSFKKLLEAIREDVNIDILNYQKNPRNTREGHGTPDAKHHNSSYALKAEENKNENISLLLTSRISSINQPGCSSLHQDIRDKRDTMSEEYMRNKKITKNDDYAEEVKGNNSSSTVELSGVYPLLSSPQLPQVSSNDDIALVKENRITNWLKSISDTEQFENPNSSPKLLTNLFLDDTATVVSGISLMSSVSNVKVEQESYISDNSNSTVREISDSMKTTETSLNNAENKEKPITTKKPLLRQEIKPASTEHKLKYKATHARVQQRLRKVVDKNSKKNFNDSVKSNKDAINSINISKQLDASNATKETWNRVVKIGKEMRSKKKKLKSLDISKECTNTTRNRKLSTTNLHIDAYNQKKKDESKKIEIDQNEEDVIIECNSTYDKSNETCEQQSLQNTSFISLEKEGRVPIMSLRREQMDDIIGVATNPNERTNDQESNSLDHEDQGTVPKKRLSLRKSNDSKNLSITDQSSPKITPVKVNLEERYNILYDSPPSLSQRNERTTPIKTNENSRINKSMLKSSLKKNQMSNTKSKEVTTIPKVAQLPNPKCNLMEQINQDKLSRDLLENFSEIIDKKITKSKRRNDIDHTNTNLIKNNKEIRVVPFNKLGTVFKKRRKVKFYKLGPVRRESLINPLTIAVLNSYKVNMVTFEESDDLLETYKIGEEECNLLDHTKSSMDLIVEKDVKNNEIHLLKDKGEKNSSKNPSQESLDVLLISLKEPTNENIVIVNDQRVKFGISESLSKKRLENCSKNGMCSKPIITNVVKMMSSENDSQLRYLDLESMIDPKLVELKISNESTSLGFKRKSEKNNDDTSLRQIINDKKRKLIEYNAEKDTKNRQIKESSDENDSDDGKLANNMTQINKLNVSVVDRINKNENVDAVISLTSESDNNINNEKVTISSLNESTKHKYKRIVIAHSSSDTDSSQTRKRKTDINEIKNNKKVKIDKKKDIASEDSEDDNVVNKILNNWCNDSSTSIKSMKKNNSEETMNFKPMIMIPQSIDFDSWNNYDTPVNIISEKEAPEKSNNDIIDKVKMIRMNENDMVTSNNKIKGIDNLNEVEIITDSLGKNFFTEENIVEDVNKLENKDNENNLPLMNCIEANDLFDDFNGSKIEDNFEDTLIEENFNEFDKENETATYVINNKNDISMKKNTMSKERDKNKRTTTVPRTTTATTLISEVEKYEDSSKSKDQLIEQKDISSEYDSLMNVTQDQLLLKALEEDLFGAGNSRSFGKSTNTKTLLQERRLENSSQTPTKSKRNLENAQNAKEISSDEDEIIENTPQSDKKFMEIDRSIVNSKARKSLTMSQTITPELSKKFQQVELMKMKTTTTPSFLVSSKLKTSINQNIIQPLYQSTPKTIQAAFNRNCRPSHSQDNKTSFESNANLIEESRMTMMGSKVNNKRLCFIWSSLMIDQIECIKKLANLINATWTQNFNSTVTHVIVSTKENTNAATKTLKFLQGIAHKKFVVGYQWIVECLKKGTLIDEEPYEAVDCYTLEAGPRKSRLRESDLFDGFAFTCIEPFENITVTQFQDLLKAMGATIIQSLDALAVTKNKHKIILLKNEIHTDEDVANWYSKTSAVPISCDWIVECISQYKLVSCYIHLHEIVQEDVLKLGYPEKMISPDEFDSTFDTSVDCKSR